MRTIILAVSLLNPRTFSVGHWFGLYESCQLEAGWTSCVGQYSRSKVASSWAYSLGISIVCIRENFLCWRYQNYSKCSQDHFPAGAAWRSLAHSVKRLLTPLETKFWLCHWCVGWHSTVILLSFQEKMQEPARCAGQVGRWRFEEPFAVCICGVKVLVEMYKSARVWREGNLVK